MSNASGPRKAIFITGAASGMGRETARLFAAKGWFVGASDIKFKLQSGLWKGRKRRANCPRAG